MTFQNKRNNYIKTSCEVSTYYNETECRLSRTVFAGPCGPLFCFFKKMFVYLLRIKQMHMIPTISWMRQTFDFYNKKYFNGSLPIPIFNIGCKYGCWGTYEACFDYSRLTRKIRGNISTGTLSLSSKYSRTEWSWTNTVIHEMIHAYIYHILKKYPRSQHGEEFMTIANRIDRDGWNVGGPDYITNTDLEL